MPSKILSAAPDSPVFSRELSWLAFNDRVLEEAENASNPALERLKFLAIVSTNLEEFFMIRVAHLFRRRAENRPYHRDGFELSDLLARIRVWVLEQKQRQSRIFKALIAELQGQGLSIEAGPSPLAREIFEKRVLPWIVPTRIPEGAPLPTIRGGKLYLLARHARSFSLLEVPKEVPRLLIVRTKQVFLFDQLIRDYQEMIFRKLEVLELFCFKASRDAEIEIDEDAVDPLREIEEGLKDRDTGALVRVEVDAPEQSPGVEWLQKQLKIESDKLYQLGLPLDLRAFLAVSEIKRFRKMRWPALEAQRPAPLPKDLSRPRFYRALDQRDILFHHPFSSFDPVVEWVRMAAADPKVIRICMTLYRTSNESPLLEALTRAARAGKKVTVLVEIKARFDEANNIRLARALEAAGARVIYSTPDIKVHAKLTYVERKTSGQPRSYAHLSTGNYHPRTAKLYTDLGLLTAHSAYTSDVRRLFDRLELMDESDDYSMLDEPDRFSEGMETLELSPGLLHERLIERIENEARAAAQGLPARIRGKMNGLVERLVIDALYRASQAGVKIDLFVRGICCLRPGVPGLSENIRVRSIVDKYLEHSRFFIFENGPGAKTFISSADWMPRNFFRRIEVAAPLLNPRLDDYVANTLWPLYDADNQRARECSPEGLYQVKPTREAPRRVQLELEKIKVPDVPALPSTAPKPAPSTSPAIPSKEPPTAGRANP